MSATADRPLPSTVAIAVATSILSGIAGFLLGQASSLGLLGSTKDSSRAKRTAGSTPGSSSDEEDDEDVASCEFRQPGAAPDNIEECKLVLVVRTDLGMTKGKIAAQCSHATLACYKSCLHDASKLRILKQWERYGQAKVALQAKTEEELDMLQAKAKSLGICVRLIHDQGRTQIAAGSATVLGVGPAPKSVVDEVTGHLKLL